MPEQEINNGKDCNKSKAASAPFPPGIASYQSFQPIIHVDFYFSYMKTVPVIVISKEWPEYIIYCLSDRSVVLCEFKNIVQ
jgi:hypothetical protein